MKILEDNINIYSSEMPAEAVESYERYYKNLNESTTVEHIQTKARNDGKEMVEIKENDLRSEVLSKPNDELKKNNDNDSVKKRMTPLETAVDVIPNKKRKKEELEPPKLQGDNRDIFCWRCHKYVGMGDSMACYFCPRVFHLKCTQMQEKPSNYWLCMECDSISTAENPDKIPPSLSKLQKKDLAELLTYVLKRMRQHEGSSHYENSVDADSYPDYKDYIIKPMYLSLLEDNVKNLKYSSCESFLADSKWMVHNSYVFNTVHSELTLFAKAMMKNAKHECDEIINCPDCYLHANTLDEDNWFIEPCEKPHILVWARLKGFPYWPCKVMKTSGSTVDVRFFGDHNKSLVPVDCCYLYSKQMPSKQKKVEELEVAIKEAGLHIKRLEKKFHVFQYAPQRTMYNPKEEEEQRKMLLPYHANSFFIKVKDRDKLFDPKVAKNIFDEPLPNGDSIHQGEDKNKTKPTEFSNESNNIDNSDNTRNYNEEIPLYRPPLINIHKSPPSLNKPIILVEDDDSDILSVCNIINPRQYNSRKCDELNSSLIMNKSRLLISEKDSVDDSLKARVTKHDNSIISIPKSLTQSTNNINVDHLSDEIFQTNCHDSSEENLKASALTNGSDLSEENSKSDENIISLISDKVNTASSNSPNLDKRNTGVISDKLRISSNAKLINVITDDPSLINNYIFKPMVVIQKLKDEVFRDYSSNMCTSSKVASFNNLTTSKESILKKTNTNNNVENSQLNFNLLNGNISDLVNMTEIDLDNDESLLKVDNIEVKNGLKFIKTEKIEDYDDPVDSDYVKRLSKSILESTLIYDPEFENNSLENIPPIATEKLSSTEAIDENISCHELDNSKCAIILNQEKILEVSNTATIDNKPDKVDVTLSSDQQVISLIDEELTDPLLPKWSKAGINENSHKSDLTLNEKEIGCDKVEHNTTNSLLKEQDVESPLQKVNIICPDEKLRNVYHLKAIENTSLDKNVTECDDISSDKCKIVPQDNICMVKNQLNTLASCSNVHLEQSGNIVRKKIVFSESTVQNESLIDSKVDILTSRADSDCEIVDIVVPRKSPEVTKSVPVRYGRIKTGGGIFKKVIKNGVMLPASKKRPIGHVNSRNLSSESVIMLSNSYGRNLAKASCQPSISKTISTLNKFNEKSLTKKDVVNQATTIGEEDNTISMEIETILRNVEKIDSKENLVQMLREQLKNFEKHCTSKLESFKNAYIEEMDSLYNLEKQHWIQESMNVCENESKMMIDEIKKKQWCILCLNEAKYHCCWSTSYCSEKCQLADWPVHIKTCTQYLMKAGDPDLRLSPGIKKIYQDDPSNLRELKIQDIINSVMENKSKAAVRACSSGSSYNKANTTSSNITSKSTVYVTKQDIKDRSQGMSENSGNHLVEVVPNQSLHVSGMASTTNPTKGVIHVHKHNPVNQNITQKGLNPGEVANNKKSVVFTVPISNRNNNTLVSIGKNINRNNISATSNNRQTVLMGKQHFILPKTLLPTKIIKKSVPILTPKNTDCIQENTSPLMNSKPFYISMPNKTITDTLDISNGMTTNRLDNSKILEKGSSLDGDMSNSAKSFLIVEKSGETSSYAYRIGFQEGTQPVHEVNILPSTQMETASIALLSHPSTSNH